MDHEPRSVGYLIEINDYLGLISELTEKDSNANEYYESAYKLVSINNQRLKRYTLRFQMKALKHYSQFLLKKEQTNDNYCKIIDTLRLMRELLDVTELEHSNKRNFIDSIHVRANIKAKNWDVCKIYLANLEKAIGEVDDYQSNQRKGLLLELKAELFEAKKGKKHEKYKDLLSKSLDCYRKISFTKKINEISILLSSV